MKTFRPCLAEFVGTFYLCFPGIAAILATAKGVEPGAALVVIALAHGLGLSLAISNFGGVSGAHVNPAVTCGFLVTGRVTPTLAVAYIISQLLGATTAAGFCRFIFPADIVAAVKLGLPLPAAWALMSLPNATTTPSSANLLTASRLWKFACVTHGRSLRIGRSRLISS